MGLTSLSSPSPFPFYVTAGSKCLGKPKRGGAAIKRVKSAATLAYDKEYQRQKRAREKEQRLKRQSGQPESKP